MKYFLFLRFSLFAILTGSSLLAQGQVNMSAITQQQLQMLKSGDSGQDPAEAIRNNYPLYNIGERYYLSVLAKVSDDFKPSWLPPGIVAGSRIANVMTLKIPLDRLEAINTLEGIDYLEISARIQPEISKAVIDVRADSVHRGIDLPQAFTGKNVIVGVTDWGFDYTHPMFYDTSLNQTRILAAWDQFKLSGSPPAGFNYGKEYAGAGALAAAQSDTVCTYYDYATHGSHVAGIAGGSGAGLGLRGMAFECNFLFTQIYLDAAAVIDAVSWMKSFADKEQKRLVVNMSWGLYHLGPLDGTSLLSQALEGFSDDGVVIVTSNGNNGSINFHIKKEFGLDTIITQVDFYSYNAHASMWGQSISMWGEAGHSFSAGISVYDGTTLLVSSPFYSTADLTSYLDSMLISGTDTVFFNVTADAAHPLNQRPFMRLRVKNTNTKLKVILKSFATDGTVHYWNVTELSNGAGNWGMPFEAFGANGTGGDRLYGVGEPACTEAVISVAAHYSEELLSNGTVKNGLRAGFSSEGPTLDDRVKPDVSAPGVEVISSISSFTTDDYTLANTTNFNGRTYDFAAFSGTSMASPAVAGVVALMLQANPDLSASQVKTILKNTAREDNRTGIIPAAGSTKWGWGKVTATAAVKAALIAAGVKRVSAPPSISLYPNPVPDLLTIGFGAQELTGELTVYDLQGKSWLRLSFRKRNELQVETEFLPKGLYIVSVVSGSGPFHARFVKN